MHIICKGAKLEGFNQNGGGFDLSNLEIKITKFSKFKGTVSQAHKLGNGILSIDSSFSWDWAPCFKFLLYKRDTSQLTYNSTVYICLYSNMILSGQNHILDKLMSK